ncbi:MAG TPA: thiamine phosphate synthase [Rickettsiales bacterium]|nr:thiamine phosphate synthase [Rickettsiales bacterium]
MTQIYLISPPKIELKDFSLQLEIALKTGLVPAFQLRLKDYERNDITFIARQIKKICQDNNCLFILNDDYQLAFEVVANGVHLGSDDGSIKKARQFLPQNFIIGASCYDSKHLAIQAVEDGANYISYGAFFASQTKKSKGNPKPDIISWSVELLDVPIVAIGGINDQNCKILVDVGVDFIAVISYVWQHPQGVAVAIRNIASKLNN